MKAGTEFSGIFDETLMCHQPTTAYGIRRVM
jgi:hypothetical protein